MCVKILSEIEERYIKVEELTPRSRNINMTVKVISINPTRDVSSRRDGSSHRVTEALVADETGSVLLTLWDDTIDEVSEGDIYDVRNGYVRLFRGSIRVNTGRYGSLTLSEEAIEETNVDNNMSDRQYEQERRSYGGGGYGGRRQSYPRRSGRDRRY
jgi:replication factor A1